MDFGCSSCWCDVCARPATEVESGGVVVKDVAAAFVIELESGEPVAEGVRETGVFNDVHARPEAETRSGICRAPFM